MVREGLNLDSRFIQHLVNPTWTTGWRQLKLPGLVLLEIDWLETLLVLQRVDSRMLHIYALR